MESQNLPHVLRESQFRRFERHIAKAITIYPEVLICPLDGFGLSATSFAARLRDAKASYSKNNWPSMLINRQRFLLREKDLIVSQDDQGRVLLGSAESIRQLKNKSKEVEIDFTPQETLPTADRSIHLADLPIKGFMMLLSHKRFLQPRIIIHGLTDPEAHNFQSQFDIALEKNPDGTYVLI